MNIRLINKILVTYLLLLILVTGNAQISTNQGFEVLGNVPSDTRDTLTTLGDTSNVVWIYPGLLSYAVDQDAFWYNTGSYWKLFESGGLNNFYTSNDTLYAVSTDSTYSVFLPYALQLADSTTILRSLIDIAGSQYIDTLQLQGDTLLQISLFGDNQPLKELNLSALSGDNLGDHIMTQNLQTNGNWISGDGGNEGLYVDGDGNVGVNTTRQLLFPLTSNGQLNFTHSRYGAFNQPRTDTILSYTVYDFSGNQNRRANIYSYYDYDGIGRWGFGFGSANGLSLTGKDDFFRIDVSTGRLGVKTDFPMQPLHITGTTRIAFDSNNYFDLKSNDEGDFTVSPVGQVRFSQPIITDHSGWGIGSPNLVDTLLTFVGNNGGPPDRYGGRIKSYYKTFNDFGFIFGSANDRGLTYEGIDNALTLNVVSAYVGVNTDSPEYILDINSSNSAVRFPNTTSLPLGADGLLTYSPYSSSFLAYYNAQWNTLADRDWVLSNSVTAEVNDLSSAVTWANIPDANITQSSVTQHQAALSITENQISDLEHTPNQTIDTLSYDNTTGVLSASLNGDGEAAKTVDLDRVYIPGKVPYTDGSGFLTTGNVNYNTSSTYTDGLIDINHTDTWTAALSIDMDGDTTMKNGFSIVPRSSGGQELNFTTNGQSLASTTNIITHVMDGDPVPGFANSQLSHMGLFVVRNTGNETDGVANDIVSSVTGKPAFMFFNGNGSDGDFVPEVLGIGVGNTGITGGKNIAIYHRDSTVDNSASFPPHNFLYTNSTGVVMSAPGSKFPVTNPLGGTNNLQATIDSLNANLGGGGGASQLSDLSDVNTSTPTNRNVLVADGVDWESRPLVEADISDLQSYLTSAITSLNGLTGSAQTFAKGGNTSAFDWNSTGTTHTLSIYSAGSSTPGVVSTIAQTFAGEKTFTGATTRFSSTLPELMLKSTSATWTTDQKTAFQIEDNEIASLSYHDFSGTLYGGLKLKGSNDNTTAGQSVGIQYTAQVSAETTKGAHYFDVIKDGGGGFTQDIGAASKIATFNNDGVTVATIYGDGDIVSASGIASTDNITVGTNLVLSGGSILDENISLGNAGEVLSRTATGVDWVDPSTLGPVFATYSSVGASNGITTGTPDTLKIFGGDFTYDYAIDASIADDTLLLKFNPGSLTEYPAGTMDPINDRVLMFDNSATGFKGKSLDVIDLQGGPVNTTTPANASTTDVNLESAKVGFYEQIIMSSITTGFTLTFSNPINGGTYVLHFRTVTGTDAVTFPSNVYWMDETAVGTVNITQGTKYTMYYDGTNYYME